MEPPPSPLASPSRISFEAPAGASAWSSVFTMVNVAVGAGVLSFPFAFLCTGWLAGALATCIIASLETYTLIVLARHAELTASTSYGELVRKSLGPGAAVFVSATVFFYVYGSCVAYLIIFGDCTRPLLTAAFGEVWFTGRSAVISILSAIFMLPLCFPLTQDALAGVSTAKFYGLILVVGAVVVRSIQKVSGEALPWDDVKALSLTHRIWSALPILVFGFQCHTNVVGVFSELEEYPSLFPSKYPAPPGAATAGSIAAGSSRLGEAAAAAAGSKGWRQGRQSAKMAGMTHILMASIGLVCLFYCCTGLSGYLAFPTSAASNILNNFPPDDAIIQVARAMVGVFMIASYPINYNPGRAAVRDILFATTGHQFAGSGFNAIATLTFYATTLAIALLVTDLGTIFQLVGGTCGGLMIFTFPGMLLMKHAYTERARGRNALQEPLLAAESEEGQPQSPAAEAREQGLLQGQQAAGGRYSYWASKPWWVGLGLVAFSIALFGVTVYTTFFSE